MRTGVFASLATVSLAAVLLATPAGAVRMITNDETPTAAFEEAVAMIDAERYDDAIALLEGASALEPNSADVWNLLGFAYRKSGRNDEAFTVYNKALLLNPDHVGANEYLGELYLQVGDLEKAKAQLRILEDLCSGGDCPEVEQLKAAIAAHQAGKD
ncbi:MAG: hypothetical protein Kilf2KO_37920 [Rhodospirillales bacterium]